MESTQPLKTLVSSFSYLQKPTYSCPNLSKLHYSILLSSWLHAANLKSKISYQLLFAKSQPLGLPKVCHLTGSLSAYISINAIYPVSKHVSIMNALQVF